MLEGIATVTVYAADLDEAERWYSGLFDTAAYFRVPGYVEFRVGPDEQEFGIIDARFAPGNAGLGGAIVYWHVTDLDAAVARLLDVGAHTFQPVSDRGNGFRTAAVADPFGNVLGVMTNPHWAGRHDAG